MTLYQFKALDEHHQHEVLWEKGVFITDRAQAGYQIDAFYVELTYDNDINKIVRLRSFLNTNRLEPYLKYSFAAL